MQIKLDRLYVDRTLRTIHAAELRDDLSTKYYCRIVPVHESKKFTLGNTYSLTKEGTYYTSGTKHSNDAIVEIDETIIDGSIALYILSDLFEQCWITEKDKIRMRINNNWFNATYEQNSLAHIDSTISIQRRSILTKFSFNCDKRLSKKYNKLFDILLKNGTK